MGNRARPTPAVALATAALWLAVGCSSGGAKPADGAAGSSSGASGSAGAAGADGAAGTEGGTGGALSTIFGTISVDLFPESAYATVRAQFFDAQPPPIMPLRVGQEQAGCQLLVPTNPTCAQGCDGGVCTGANTCAPIPEAVNVGAVAVDGLSGMSLTLDAVPPMFAYSGPTLTQPFPPCAEGGDISVRTDTFAVAIKCIAPLVVTSAAPIPVFANQATRITWTPPGRAGISRVQIALEISHHGGFKGEIDCDVADTGSFDIPAPLITALIDLGRAGYPTVKIVRAATATAPAAPGVKLTMPSLAELEVDTGVISCGAPGSPPCPTGMTCRNEDFTCQ